MSKNKSPRNVRIKAESSPELPRRAIGEIADWMLDLARRSADGEREDLAAIERVRRATHAAIGGRKVRIPSERDIIIAASHVVTAVERDLGIDGLGAAVASSFDVLTNTPVEATPLEFMPGCGSPVRTTVPSLPARTCPHRGPLVAPYRRCAP